MTFQPLLLYNCPNQTHALQIMLGHCALRYLFAFLYAQRSTLVVIILLTIRGDILLGFLNFRHHGELNPGQMGLGLACLSFELTPLPACWIEPVLISHPLNSASEIF